MKLFFNFLILVMFFNYSFAKNRVVDKLINGKYEAVSISVNYAYTIKGTSFSINIEKINTESFKIEYQYIQDLQFSIDTSFFVNIDEMEVFKELECRLENNLVKPTENCDIPYNHNDTFVFMSYRKRTGKVAKGKTYKIYGGYYNVNSVLLEYNFPVFNSANNIIPLIKPDIK